MEINKNRKIEIVIDGKKFSAEEGQTVLDIARKEGIDIPSLCFHPDLCVKANCRLCLVKIKGRKGMVTSCSTMVEQGMDVLTDDSEINKARKINLELLFSQHCEECNDCIWSYNCHFLSLAKKYGVKITRFKDRKKGYPCYKFGPCIDFDSSKCIDCRNCVDVCAKQSVNFLEVREKGHLFQVLPSEDKKTDCIYCGQCIVHCPVGAFEAVGEFEEIEEPLKDKNKIVVFQFAPSIRTSIGEEFGLPYGEVVTEKLVAAIRKLGANKVFDTSVGADFTTVEEANELIEKVIKNCGPCLSSCCPSWVKFIEFNYPEFIPHIATTRSPQFILGGIIKTYWAKKEKIDPKKIIVVSVMPCTSKKYEAQRKEMEIDGLKPIDYVLTTRELAFLLKRHKIDLKTIKPEKADDPLGVPSGAGVIYGASGGVMESALRTAYAKLTKKKMPKLEFKEVRGLQGMKEAVIGVDGKKIKVAVVNGLGVAREVLEKLKKNPKLYDAVEVMACYGGCIGGGGQPVPADAKIRQERAKALYDIDDKKELRLAHENPILKEVYKNFLVDEKIIHKICHTSYSKKKKEVDFKNKK